MGSHLLKWLPPIPWATVTEAHLGPARSWWGVEFAVSSNTEAVAHILGVGIAPRRFLPPMGPTCLTKEGHQGDASQSPDSQ